MKYKGANLLVVRQTESSNRDSTFAELVSAINRCGLRPFWDIKTSPLSLTCKVTGNSIIFRGCNDERARERIKSISFKQGKLVWVWVEECNQCQSSDISTLDDRLRGELSNPNLYFQITLSSNPCNAQSWLKLEYWDWDSPDVFKCHSTWRDNRFVGPEYAKRMERMKEIDYERWLIYSEGQWGSLGGLILTNYVIEDLSKDFDRYNTVLYAQDFGFQHANVVLEVAEKDNELYILRELYVREKDTGEIIELADKMELDRSKIMICDSAEPDRIKMWQKAGYRARPVKKGAGSVNAQIDYLKQHRIHIDGSCINTIKEIQQWSWVKDKTTGQYIDEPVPLNDDCMAALRYATDLWRQDRRIKTLSKSALGL